MHRDNHYSVAPVGAIGELVFEELIVGIENIPLNEGLSTVELDSLTAMSLAWEARKAGLIISLPTIFQNPRLFKLAAILSQKPDAAKQEPSPVFPTSNPLMVSMDEMCTQGKLHQTPVLNIVTTTYHQQSCVASHHADNITQHFFSATITGYIPQYFPWPSARPCHPSDRLRFFSKMGFYW